MHISLTSDPKIIDSAHIFVYTGRISPTGRALQIFTVYVKGHFRGNVTRCQSS